MAKHAETQKLAIFYSQTLVTPQVCDFVKGLPGCSDYVEDFQLQEIDGQALMLLKADHLMSAMAIKLGPALKICNAIDAMREELKQN